MFQERLGKALLWCACRKHVGEVLLTKAWNALNVEASKSPDISVFIRFREKFPDLDLMSPMHKDSNPSSPFLQEQKLKVISLLSSIGSDESLSHLLP